MSEELIITGVIVAGVPDATGTILSEEAAADLQRQWVARVERGEHTICSSGVALTPSVPPLVGLSISPDLDDKRVLLEQVEREARELQANIQRAQWGVLRLLERIRDQDLYRAALNPLTGAFYT